MLDFWNNPLRIFAAHELAAIIDPAMTTKMTVQFNLFGGTVLKLGTERHHKALLEGICLWIDRNARQYYCLIKVLTISMTSAASV